jgi:epoxyqueuosine reductase
LDQRERTDALKAQAAEAGFDACCVARAGAVDLENRLGRWLADGFHADMDWMERTQAIRQDVTLKVPGAKSVVVLARNYHHPRPAAVANSGKVASYAWGRDYHNVLKKPLRRLGAYLTSLEEGAESYASVDSGPVLERSWAERAGLGWIGKNSLVLRGDLGSWFFIGTIITTVELVPDAPVLDRCGTCTRCIDACPTGAIIAPAVVDSNRCISYQTIENRGEVPEDLHGDMGDWVFGCDVCQEVCPWNRFERVTDESDFHPREGQANPALQTLSTMGREDFDERFIGTPIRRTKHAGMVRNARIVAKNQGDGVAGRGAEETSVSG